MGKVSAGLRGFIDQVLVLGAKVGWVSKAVQKG
jgi:hypothetical protein